MSICHSFVCLCCAGIAEADPTLGLWNPIRWLRRTLGFGNGISQRGLGRSRGTDCIPLRSGDTDAQPRSPSGGDRAGNPARYAVAYRRSSAPTEEVTMIHRLDVWARLDSRTSGAHRPPADAMPSVPKQEIRVYAQREELAGLLRREQAATPERSP